MAGRRLAGCFPVLFLSWQNAPAAVERKARLVRVEPSFFFLACDNLLARSAFIQQEGLNLLFIPDAREPTSCHSAFSDGPRCRWSNLNHPLQSFDHLAVNRMNESG
jgi:hypothetical protein